MINQKKNKLELLAPAGSLETFKAVIHAGADAVYLGGNSFGARAYANNFSKEELLYAIDYAHIHGRQLYLTVNTLLKEQELEHQLYEYLLPYYKQGLDAVIVQDLGAFSFIREAFGDLEIHTSTQMTVTNRYGAQLMKDMGASRVVTAREMSFAEIKDIADHVDVEIESFVHGALCYCFSGQCLLSSMLGGRSGNRGRCAQPCRLPYEVFDKTRKKIIKTGPYVLSPKDLCTIDSIPYLAENGIFSFKIEGRMKQAEYAAGVVSVYRKYMDRYLEYGKEGYKVLPEDAKKLFDFGNRTGFTKGYYEKHNGKDMITFEKPNHAKGNEKLQNEVKETYIQNEIKEKINGELILNKEFPAKMEIDCKGVLVSVTGDIVQAALKQPLSQEKIKENAKKTGNTPFEFEELVIEAEQDIFMPMKSINQLRRDALEALEVKLTESYRRSEPIKEHSLEMIAAEKEETGNRVETMQRDWCEKNRDCEKLNTFSDSRFIVSIESRSQLSYVLSYEAVDDVYLDNSCYTRKDFAKELVSDVNAIHNAKKLAYYILPTVFRKKSSDFYLEQLEILKAGGLDGIVVKSYDALHFVKKMLPELSVICDQNLYTYNNRAVKALSEQNPLRLTVPFELNRKEIERRKNENSEMVIYGYLPLMTSAQCVHANTGKCDKVPDITYLKDRYGKYFPVKNNCMECYNTLYNTTPLMLFGYGKELRDAGIRAFRLSFTIEEETEINEVFSLYEEVFQKGVRKLNDIYSGEYTNGHYKRGVE